MTRNRNPTRVWIPSSLTAANIALGFGAIVAAADGRVDAAVWMLYFAVILDTMDGKVARWLSATSEFGKELDSFCDAISFGAAPAFLIYQTSLGGLGAPGLVAALAFLLAGVLRLARFNLTEDAHGKSARTVGVPIPVGAGYVMAMALMRDHISPTVVALGVVLLAVGMVSRWPLPNIKGKTMVSAMIAVGIFNYTLLMVRPNWWTVGWWNVWNIVILLAARAEDRTEEAVSHADA